jgi:hypothetical protein
LHSQCGRGAAEAAFLRSFSARLKACPDTNL